MSGKKKMVRSLVRTRCGVSDDWIEAGRLGEILAYKPGGRVLVKWRRKSWPSDHDFDELELA